MIGAYYRFLAGQGWLAFSRGIPYARYVEYPRAVAKLELGPDDWLLDVGSRYSPLPQVLALRYGCRVCAVDPEPDFRERQLAMARKNRQARKLVDSGRLEFQVADAGHLPHPSGSFSRISVISVLEHVDDERPVVAELARVLAPGGRLVITVPFDPWRDQPKYHRQSIYVQGKTGHERFYMRYYNERNLDERLVGPSGLRLLHRGYFGEPGFNAHNLLYGNPRIPWPIKRILFQPLVPLLAPRLIRDLPPERFRRKTKIYTADTALLVLGRPPVDD